MEKKTFSKREKEVKNPISFDIKQPSAIEIEQSVLGALLVDKQAISEVRGILFDSEIFYDEKNEKIYRAICQLSDNNLAVDIRTVTNQLRKNIELDSVGGAYYISQLSFNIQSAANIEYHARILVQYWMKRLIIKISLMNASKAYQDDFDVFEILDKSLSQLMRISEKIQSKPTVTAKNVIVKTIKEIEEARKERGLTGMPTGFSAIDKITGGFQKSDLIIIAGRPGMGKTTWALNAIKNTSLNYNKPGIFISLEMSIGQLMTKLISCETHISTNKINKGLTTDSEIIEIVNASNKLYTDNLIFDDTSGLTFIDIKSKATAAKAKHKIEWIVIDYLQLVSNPGQGNREQEISSITRGLKNLAKELNVPIIALSQLSRAVESRSSSKRPQLSDLRESGAIEQDADVVCFLYRPEYYGIDEYENGDSTKNTCEFIIAKHRNGPVIDLKLYCDLEHSKFTNLNDTYFNPIDDTHSEPSGEFKNDIFSTLERNQEPTF